MCMEAVQLSGHKIWLDRNVGCIPFAVYQLLPASPETVQVLLSFGSLGVTLYLGRVVALGVSSVQPGTVTVQSEIWCWVHGTLGIFQVVIL